MRRSFHYKSRLFPAVEFFVEWNGLANSRFAIGTEDGPLELQWGPLYVIIERPWAKALPVAMCD